MMSHRPFKDRLYPQFARIGQALASERRLELLDLLVQASRNVEALARETGMSVANVSQHLKVLLAAKLVEARRSGTRVFYHLADESVLRLWLALCSAAEGRLPEMDRLAEEFLDGRENGGVIGRDDLERVIDSGQAVLLDVRPSLEYEHGHLPGAVSVPIDELEGRLDSLSRDRLIVTYCRGEYCLFADEAAALLRERGFRVARLEGGWSEWRAEGRAREADVRGREAE